MLVTDPTTAARPAISLRTLFDAPDATALAGTIAQSPGGGLSDTAMAGSGLLAATYRFLDSRILATALSCLDQDLGGPLVRRLALFKELRDKAEATATGKAASAMVDLAEGHRLATSQGVVVQVHLRGATFDFPFRLELALVLARTRVGLSRGAIDRLECGADLSASLWYADATPALWTDTKQAVAITFPVEPPVGVPLNIVATPPPPTGAVPRARAPGPPGPVRSPRAR